MKKNRFVGILLAGGLSRRYGSPKAFSEISGKKFYEITYDILAKCCDDVIVVTRKEFFTKFPSNLYVTSDIEPFVGCGPLAGIYSAMEKVKAEHYVVLPCDMPLMDESVIKGLIASHHKDVTAVRTERFLQPLVSVWSARVKPYIKDALLAKRYKMKDVLSEIELHEIDGAVLSNNRNVFMNINTPEQDEEMRKWERL